MKTKEQRRENWQSREHDRAIKMAREMIPACAGKYTTGEPFWCPDCVKFADKSCPARHYLKTYKQPDAWECPQP